MNKSRNPLIGWTVDRNAIKTIGQGLQRPECILAERDGTLWSADARGGVMRIHPDGTQQLIAQTGHRGIDVNDPTSYILGGATLPNGIAMNRDGDFLIANFGSSGPALFRKLEKQGILLRDRSKDMGPGFVRITIGTRPEMRRLLQAIRKEWKAPS